MALNRAQLLQFNRLVATCESLLSRLVRETREVDAWIADFPEMRRLMGVVNDLDARIGDMRKALERKQKKLVTPENVTATQQLLSNAFRSIMEQASSEGPSSAALSASPKADQKEEGKVASAVFPAELFSVAEALQFLGYNRKTGTVKIKCASETLVIELQDGDVVNAYSTNTPKGLRLGEILVAHGHLSPATLETLLDKYRDRPSLLGRRLAEENIVPKKAILEALKVQVDQLFRRAVAADGIPVEFTARAQSQSPGDVNLNLTAMLLEGAALSDKPD